jgi:hypothetical protein
MPFAIVSITINVRFSISSIFFCPLMKWSLNMQSLSILSFVFWDTFQKQHSYLIFSNSIVPLGISKKFRISTYFRPQFWSTSIVTLILSFSHLFILFLLFLSKLQKFSNAVNSTIVSNLLDIALSNAQHVKSVHRRRVIFPLIVVCW